MTGMTRPTRSGEVRRLIHDTWQHALHDRHTHVAIGVHRIHRANPRTGVWHLMCALADRVTDAWRETTGQPYDAAVVVPGWVDSTTGAAVYPSTDGQWCGWWVAARANRDLDHMHALFDPLAPSRRREMACALISRAVATIRHLEQQPAEVAR